MGFRNVIKSLDKAIANGDVYPVERYLGGFSGAFWCRTMTRRQSPVPGTKFPSVATGFVWALPDWDFEVGHGALSLILPTYGAG